MSMTKRILFDRDPRDDAVRERMRAEASEYLSGFPHRLAMKRKSQGGGRYWDALWPISLEQAVRELGIEVVRVNGGLFAREADEIESIRTRAEAIWQERQQGRR